METAQLEQGINNPEAVDKIYDALEDLQIGNTGVTEAYSLILETIYLDILKAGK